jgi:hypothetical protein
VLPRPDRPRVRDRALRLAARYGAPALLAAVAVVQSWQTERLDLSPWKGGGFGMFSTVDAPKARFLRLFLETPEGEVPVPPPASLARSLREVQTLPTARRLSRLVTQLAAATWAVPDLPRVELERVEETPETTLEEGGPQPHGISTPVVAPVPLLLLAGEPVPAGFTPIETRAVRVEVWRFHFEPERARLVMEHLRSARAERLIESDGGSDG